MRLHGSGDNVEPSRGPAEVIVADIGSSNGFWKIVLEQLRTGNPGPCDVGVEKHLADRVRFLPECLRLFLQRHLPVRRFGFTFFGAGLRSGIGLDVR